MGKLLFFFLAILKFFRRINLRIKGITEDDLHSKRVITGKSWEDFCDNLKSAGASLMYPGTPRDSFQQAEGIRYLSRLTRGGLEAFLEFGDPAFPVFRHTASDTIKLGADNPDNIYLNAQISGKYEYRILGKRNSIHYLGFFTQNGSYGTTGGLAPCATLDHRDLLLEDDDTFEIIVSKEQTGKNWLKMEDDSSMVMVRQTFFDKQKEIPAEIKILNLDGREKPDPISCTSVDEGLANAALFVAGASMLFARWANDFKKHTNQLPMFDPSVSNAAGGDAGIVYHHSYWKLRPEQALVIEVRPPDCESWNFQLNNYWMESLDYRYFNISVNKAGAITEPDGTVRIIVAAINPGVPNWIETCGHTEGTMLWRWYRLENGAQPVEPSCKVMEISEIINIR